MSADLGSLTCNLTVHVIHDLEIGREHDIKKALLNHIGVHINHGIFMHGLHSWCVVTRNLLVEISEIRR